MNFNNKLFLAPMLSVTDKNYRQECINNGCDVVETPLISAVDLIKRKEAAINEVKSISNQHPFGVQIFCSNCPDALAACKEILKITTPDYIDINCCCPSPRVTKDGAGASLMRDPKLINRIIKFVKKEIKVPITVKILSGWNKVNAVEVSKLAQEAGAAAIFIHPRTKVQGYEGIADLKVIADVKRSVKIPVIGNGDVNSYIDYINMIEKTNCNGVMIGRGSVNPKIFNEIKSKLA